MEQLKPQRILADGTSKLLAIIVCQHDTGSSHLPEQDLGLGAAVFHDRLATLLENFLDVVARTCLSVHNVEKEGARL